MDAALLLKLTGVLLPIFENVTKQKLALCLLLRKMSYGRQSGAESLLLSLQGLTCSIMRRIYTLALRYVPPTTDLNPGSSSVRLFH